MRRAKALALLLGLGALGRASEVSPVPGYREVAARIGAENYNLLQNNGPLAGQTVFHAHFHLIPKWSEDEGLVYRREPKHGLDHGEMAQRLVLPS